MELINAKTIIDLRAYLKLKTGKYYFKDIRQLSDNIQVTCPFHKDGQETKPSASIRITDGEHASIGVFHCFTCHKSMGINNVVRELLGPLYDEDEVESRFHFSTLMTQSYIMKENEKTLLFIPNNEETIKEEDLRNYRFYHTYLAKRNISEETANVYDIGYDQYAHHITFPIRNIYRKCLGIGRRDINKKQYIYPLNFVKPLYGVYELPDKVNNLWVVEGPFNLWSLYQYKKTGVALLGTGTKHQLEELVKIKTTNYVLALDPDDAGINGTKKIIEFLTNYNIHKIYVALLPNGKDINDLSEKEFREMEIINYTEWLRFFR